MPPRLSALDASFLYLEEATTPMHVGAVSIFKRPKAGFDYDRLVELIEQRIALVPRYRQKVRHVPGNLARPVWVDDPEFDVAYHVRRSALPKPGSDEQLTELVGPADVAAARPRPAAVGDVPRRGPRPRPHGRADQDPPGDGRRHQRDRHRPGHPRRLPGAPRGHRGAVDAAQRAHRRRAGLRRGGGGDRPARRGGRQRAGRRGRRGRHGRQDRGPAAAVHGPHGQPRHRPGHPAQRADLRAAPVRDRPHPARGLPQDPHGARRHGQRRRAGGGRGRAARLAAVPRRARHVVVVGAGDGADVGARAGRRAQLDHHRARWATGCRRSSWTCRWASRARWCGCTR